MLHINIANKIAKYQVRDGDIVCDNTGYKVAFTFDSEWDDHADKTARFIWNGAYKDVDIVDGECEVPKIIDATEVFVGVYAGEMKTTTDARIPCVKSVLSRTSVGQPDQVKEYRDQAGIYADEAEASAAEARAAASTAASEASSAAAASVAQKAEEMIAELGIVQEAGDSSTAVMSQIGVGTTFANALKKTAKGEVVRLSDVSPIPHRVKVRVHGKNRLNIPDASKTITNTDGLNLTGSIVGGQISLSGVFNGGSPKAKVLRMDLSSPMVNYIQYELIKEELAVPVSKGTYIFSANQSASVDISTSAVSGGYLLVGELGGTENNGKAKRYRDGAVITVDRDDCYAQFVVYIYADNPVEDFTYTAAPQLEEGTTATEYEPYIDPTSVTVRAAGKNLIPFPYVRNDGSVWTEKTSNGVTATVREDGAVVFNGTSTETTWWRLANDVLDYVTINHVRDPWNPGLYSERFTGNSNIGNDYGLSSTWSVVAETRGGSYITLKAGTYDNLVVYPQIEAGQESTDFVKGVAHSVNTPDANGELELVSTGEYMTVWAVQEGVTLEVEYNASFEGQLDETKEAIEDIVSADLAILQNRVICIGDSLTSGQYDAVEPAVASIPESFPYFLGKLTGWKVENAGVSGITPAGWYRNQLASYDFTKYDTAIIWLGTNKGLNDTLDTAQTEANYYCKLIEAIIAQNAKIKIILGTVYTATNGGNVITTNEVIHKVAARYPDNIVGVVDNRVSSLWKVSGEQDVTLHPTGGLHFGKVGNAILAKHWLRGISRIIKENPTAFETLTYTHTKSSFPYAEYGLPVVYFEGNTTGMTKDDKVTLSYRYGDRSGTCTLKWQGSSSIAYPKKNYTVVFDNAFEAVSGWGVQSKYCLKADWVDFSHCRNVVSAKLWSDLRKYVSTGDLIDRLKTLPNCGAIDGFPCFVVINGEWQGIYNFNIPKEGWMLGMGAGTKEAILCADNQSDACKFKAAAVVGTDFELEYNVDTFAESDIQTSLNRLINACINSDGTDIDTTIAQYLDIDSAIDYFIYITLMRAEDCWCKNYILATYDGVKWFFSAYDMDGVWGNDWSGKSYTLTEADPWVAGPRSFEALAKGHRLFELIYNYKRADLIARFNRIVRNPLSVMQVMYRFYNYAVNIPLAAYNAEAEMWPGIPGTATNNVAQIVAWYTDRLTRLTKEINSLT